MAIRNTGRRASSVTSAPSATEDDVRVRILNSFLSCPHRDTEKLKEIHDEIRKQDPLFYAHLACWYFKKGEVRDHNEVFSSMLVTDPYLDNREVGLALFRKHRISLKSKILGFIRGKSINIREKTGDKVKVKKGSKDAKRRKSYCARSAGQLRNSSAKTRNDPNSRIRQARRRWKCR